ncbi:MAG: 23S rRNA (pseudouridine(1915)-N(3))-methyltransferase RlmH [Henriciella sp.]
MRLTLISVGRQKSGAERDLAHDYADRFRKVGRGLGFRSLDLIDVDSGGGLEAEGTRLMAKVPAGAVVLRLDEYGSALTSKAFATQLAKRRDQGTPDLVFLIGGANGYSEAVREAYPDCLAMGPQTWPHRLVKVMLCEQLYRAASILSGSPYHKA